MRTRIPGVRAKKAYSEPSSTMLVSLERMVSPIAAPAANSHSRRCVSE
jgi:hypothetical protein